MRQISFFYNNRGAGIIDGQQIGEYLAAKLNPTEGYENDVCIYVKHAPTGDFPRNSYVNVVDGTGLISWLLAHSEIGVIVTSSTAKDFLAKKLQRKDIVFIPEHHCNYTNIRRDRKEISVIGFIGNKNGFNYDLQDAQERFSGMGFEFKWLCDYSSRRDIVEFYKTIDIQINWRNHVHGEHALLHNPLKLANAGSFGIPTVSFPEENYVAEFGKRFIEVNTIEELFEKVEMLRDNPAIYDAYSKMAMERANNYHISKISQLYLDLARRTL